jgi:gas vesicle protein
MSKGDNKKFAIGAMIGALVGVVTGILTAPKSGKETRKDIKDTAGKVFAEAEKRLKSLHKELGDLIDKGNIELKTATGKAQKELEKAVQAAKEAQGKAKEVITAIRSGETANTELQQAIRTSLKPKITLRST